MKERNIQPLSDDYIKFIRFGQHFIDKNGEGILAYISNNSFIDGIIHRQMRKHLLESFDKIYILDLHGDAKKKESCTDGSPDQNVFDIMQGVSINIFIKTGKKSKNEKGKVLHYDLQGKRNYKYDFLSNNNLASFSWNNLECKVPNLFFTNKNFYGEEEYVKGFKIDELFKTYNNGIETGKDSFFYSQTKSELVKKLDLAFLNKDDTIKKFEITDTTSFKFKEKFLNSNFNESNIRTVSYRPFDNIVCYYDNILQRRPAFSTMKNLFENNIGFLVPRQVSDNFKHVFISKFPTDCNLTGTAKKFGSAPIFPLYTYSQVSNQQTIDGSNERIPNLNMEIVNEIAKGLGLQFVPDHNFCHAELVSASHETLKQVQGDKAVFSPLDILDYIYAVLHSPTYRETYKEFLKIDFPRVPYPSPLTPKGGIEETQEKFWKLVKLGGELRQIHLLESSTVEKYITQYPNDGNNVVGKIHFENNRVYINYDKASPLGMEGLQYFANVPEVAWNFYIGGYQPAQKWLKDRKDRELSYEDILHYQKIIVALSETDRIMKEIDLIELV